MLHTLIVLRASAEGMSTTAIGVVQSAYQVGWLLAAFLVPVLIRQVGHVRVFGAVGAIGSAVILLHLFHIDPWSWSAQRLVMGCVPPG